MTDTTSTNDTCPVCGNRNFAPYRMRLLRCVECGMVLSPSIWHPRINERMEDEWFGEDYSSRESGWVKRFEDWNNQVTLKRLTSLALPGRRLLEIGVGSGSFLSAAQGQGFSVTGCDLSASICQHVQQSRGIVMHEGNLSSLVGKCRFDVVVLNHVLEHVTRPIEFMHDVSRLLSFGGVAHVAVPNVACWEAVLPGWTSYEPYHLTYFAPRTLRDVIGASGLDIEQVCTRESFSGWFLAVLRTFLRVSHRGGAVTRPEAPPGKRPQARILRPAYHLVMTITGAALWPLRSLQAKLGRGDEVICIARKPRPSPQISNAS